MLPVSQRSSLLFLLEREEAFVCEINYHATLIHDVKLRHNGIIAVLMDGISAVTHCQHID